MSKEILEKMDNEMLAERIKVLFMFSTALIPYKEKLWEVVGMTRKKESMVSSIAPVLMASGIDHQAAHFEADLQRRRAEALFNLIDVLDITEKERTEETKKAGERAKNAAILRKAMGLE